MGNFRALIGTGFPRHDNEVHHRDRVGGRGKGFQPGGQVSRGESMPRDATGVRRPSKAIHGAAHGSIMISELARSMARRCCITRCGESPQSGFVSTASLSFVVHSPADLRCVRRVFFCTCASVAPSDLAPGLEEAQLNKQNTCYTRSMAVVEVALPLVNLNVLRSCFSLFAP